MAIDIQISDVTTFGDVNPDTGNEYTINDAIGVFDRLMKTTLAHIDREVDDNRITQGEAGEVYASAIQAVLNQSIAYVLQEKQVEVQIDKINSDRDISEEQSAKDLLLKDAQIELYNKQRDGFDHDAKQKLIKVLMDSWSVLFSSAPDADLIPDAMKRQNLDKVVEDAMISLGISETLDMTYDTIDGLYPDDTGITVES